jgi:hypothetical protein
MPPHASFSLAEQHGKLDGIDPEICAEWLRRATAPPTIGPDGTYSWLPDPVAAGVAIYIRRNRRA